jgi:AraC family transcriptional regulator of adaptative response / DNA-3-methyladenine glycosylase II
VGRVADDDVVPRAVRLIADGVVDRVGVGGLAREIGISERHLRRRLVAQLGAGPEALARARRAAGPLALRLPFRAPLDGDALLRWLAARAVPGVEEIAGGVYRRSLRLPCGPGVVELEIGPADAGCRLWLEDLRDVDPAVQRCRRLLDLDADPLAVSEGLGPDPLIGPLVKAAPGLRVPGNPDGAELAVRAVLGQQISVPAARPAAGRLVAEHGERLPRPRGAVTALFPSAGALAALDPERLAMPRSRAHALVGLCRAAASGELRLDAGADPAQARDALMALPGIGPWTADYVAMRALGDPDVFVAGDLGVRRALRRLGGPDDPRQAITLAARWAPWRSYATQYLWQAPALAV